MYNFKYGVCCDVLLICCFSEPREISKWGVLETSYTTFIEMFLAWIGQEHNT